VAQVKTGSAIIEKIPKFLDAHAVQARITVQNPDMEAQNSHLYQGIITEVSM